MLSIRRAVEFTHLHVLRLLMAREWSGRYECVLKGGANLRFFYGSPRLSEDMDFDVFIPNSTMNHRLQMLFDNRFFHRSLAQKGVSIASVTQAKDTETAGKWKIQLLVEHDGSAVPTKLDLSWREPVPAPDSVPSEFADRVVLAVYGMPPFSAFHYGVDDVLRQKVKALGDRSVTQARDVFDLFWVLTTSGTDTLPKIDDKDRLTDAADALNSLDYDTFVSHVGPFMEDSEKELYVNKQMWNEILRVVGDQLLEQL